MTLTVLDTAAASLQILLVSFHWGVSNVARYNRGTTNLLIGGETYYAEPTLTFRFDNPLSGGTDDSPMSLQMMMTKPPFTTLCLPYTHAAVKVLVEFFSPSDGEKYEVFSGRIGRIKVKPGGVQGLASAKVVGTKARLNATLGIPALSSCVHKFGDENQSRCGVPLDAKRVNGTITAVSYNGIMNAISVSGLPAGDYSNTRWNRGYIEYDGLRITIRRSYGTGVYYELKMQPPPYWLGKLVTLTPGCDKTLATCRYWQNESQFLAPGFAMPNRNPVFEE